MDQITVKKFYENQKAYQAAKKEAILRLHQIERAILDMPSTPTITDLNILDIEALLEEINSIAEDIGIRDE